jgi:type III pantothenate kinase
MKLVIDIGNSDITVGANLNGHWKNIWRIPTSPRPELYYGIHLRDLFLEADLNTYEVESVVISSVVPDLTEILSTVVKTLFGTMPVIVGPAIYDKLKIKVMNPYQIGSDLVANAVAAYSMFNSACIIIDFGTALTYTTLRDDGEIIGVAIAPGLKTSLKSLSQNTAKLFDVPLEMPDSVLGKNTVHAIQAGILIGCEGAVIHMLQRIKAEVKDNVKTVATGGLCNVIASLTSIVDRVEPNLTLNGLLEIGQAHYGVK